MSHVLEVDVAAEREVLDNLVTLVRAGLVGEGCSFGVLSHEPLPLVPSHPPEVAALASAASGGIAKNPLAVVRAERLLRPEDSSKRLPVTVLSGFLGAGKSTLLQHLLRASHGLRIAVLVNDMAEINIDADLIRDVLEPSLDPAAAVGTVPVELRRAAPRLVSLQNGCICCTLREDLLVEVVRLARERVFDYLIIESSGVSEPMPVAETFTFRDAHGTSLGELAVLDTLVTVVDASTFLDTWGSPDTLRQRGWEVSSDDKRSVIDLLRDQVEFSNVLVVNKCDLVSEAVRDRVVAVLRALNPGAQVVTTTEGRVDARLVMGTGRFRMQEAAASAGWLRELRGEHVPETIEYGISSFVLRVARPFHPKRLHDLLFRSPVFRPVLRSKGFVWIASRNRVGGVWEHAGKSLAIRPGGPWHAAVPFELWPEGSFEKMDVWSMQTGDRRTKLAVIGQFTDAAGRDAVRAALEACLLTDDEMVAGPAAWARFEDPFRAWPEFPLPPLDEVREREQYARVADVLRASGRAHLVIS